MDQLYRFFRDSPALQHDFDLEWDHKINYHKKLINPNPETSNLVQSPCDMIHNIVTSNIHPINFGLFHTKVYNCIQQWINKEGNRNSTASHLWETWQWDGLNTHNTFTELSRIMEVTTLEEYVMAMTNFQCFQEKFHIQWTPDHAQFWYTYVTLADAEVQQTFEEFYNIQEVKLTYLKKEAGTIEERLRTSEITVREHENQYKDSLQKVANEVLVEITDTFMKSLQDIMHTTMLNFDRAIQEKTPVHRIVLTPTKLTSYISLIHTSSSGSYLKPVVC